MALEAATFTDDLDVSNPTSTDTKSQGDDHLRLLKTVIKNSLKRVTRAFYVPGTVAKTANYSVVASDDNKTIYCDTTSAFTLTLPTLAASDAGWCVYVVKTTTDANPVWIAPPSGTINSHTKVRRAVPFSIVKVLWTGVGFFATRSFGVPIGSLIPHYGGSLPQGCLHPDGTTFVAADFVELNTTLGGNTKPDVLERMLIPLDNTAAATRVTTAGSGIDGDTKGSASGAQTVTLVTANLPAYTPTGTNSLPNILVHTRARNDTLGGGATPFDTAAGSDTNGEITDSARLANAPVFTGTAQGGTSTPVNKMPPSIVVPFVLVAE